MKVSRFCEELWRCDTCGTASRTGSVMLIPVFSNGCQHTASPTSATSCSSTTTRSPTRPCLATSSTFRAVDVGLELAYIDFGAGEDNLGPATTKVDATAITGFGTVGVDFGLFGFFGKLGYASWDLKASAQGLGSASVDGTDLAYGIGMRLNFSSLEVRAEYELFDIDDAPDDIDLLSIGVVWRF